MAETEDRPGDLQLILNRKTGLKYQCSFESDPEEQEQEPEPDPEPTLE